MRVPDGLKYRESHEWLEIKEGVARVGVTDHAQQELNDIVFVELPDVGKKVSTGDSICVLESTKAASDVYCPVSGTIKAVNEDLNDDPGLINSSPYDEGWLFEIEMSDASEAEGLLSPEEYRKKIET
jgi:glycine cleavage system H protein